MITDFIVIYFKHFYKKKTHYFDVRYIQYEHNFQHFIIAK